MNESDLLAARFEQHRAHLRAVVYRVLGSSSEADDAVQEAWLRLSRSDTSGVDNLGGWPTTVVARVCLDLLRSRRSRDEEPLGAHAPDPVAAPADGTDPEHQALLADSVGLALLVVLGTLTPAERLAFVLHDLFAMPFEEIGPVVSRSPAAARQLASRAPRRVRGADATSGGDPSRRARRRGRLPRRLALRDFEALLALLDPDVVLRADPAAVQAGAAVQVHGAADVARTFSGRARAAQPALVDGAPAAVWALGGRPRVVFAFTIVRGRIVGIDLVADPQRLEQLDVEFLGD